MAIKSQLRYAFKLNGEPLFVKLGATVVDKLEEALDEGAFNIPITVRDIEYKMYGLLEIKFIDKNNVEETFEYLIYDDSVSISSKDRFYTHEVSALEYSGKLDIKYINALTFTQPLYNDSLAPFTVANNNSGLSSGNRYLWFSKGIKIKSHYYIGETETIPVVPTVTKFTGLGYIQGLKAYVRFDGNIYYISDTQATLTFNQTGLFNIEQGYLDEDNVTLVPLFTYSVVVGYESVWTLYDVVDRIRTVTPLETLKNHGGTRLFVLDDDLVETFKKIKMPQLFLEKLSIRQALNIIFKYINAISRLKYSVLEDDLLTIDEFNKVTGTFNNKELVNFETSQDIRNYGTSSVTWLTQALQDNFQRTASVKTPSENRYKTVRANDVQLTDASFHLPLEYELYFPKKFEVMIRRVSVIWGDGPNEFVDYTNFVLDLTSRFINEDEWKLKDITVDFPDFYVIEPFETIFEDGVSYSVGSRQRRNENIFWKQFSKEIELSRTIGTFFKDTTMYKVIHQALNEYFTLNLPNFLNVSTSDGVGQYEISFTPRQDNLADGKNAVDYRNFAFNLEYVTLENPVMKTHRADISNINYDVDLRINQNTRMVNYSLQARNVYGILQRSGVPNHTFQKIYTSFNNMFKVGNIDENGYVIVKRSLSAYNDFMVANYEATKDHNRISEFTGISQEYRVWEIPQNRQVFERHEHYEDFIYIDRPTSARVSTPTLINNTFVRYAFARLFDRTINKYKITFAMIRTDGFSTVYPDQNGNYFAIMTPVVSYGGKGGLVFTFGFDHNQIAGNMIRKANNNYYNEAVRYTDIEGRFNMMWFGLADTFRYNTAQDFTSIGGVTEYFFNREYKYPLFKGTNEDLNQEFLVKTGTIDGISYNPLVIYKDSSEKIKMNYQVSILPYDFRDYVIGNAFYTDNRLANDPSYVGALNTQNKLYLYKYRDNTKYTLFEDLLVKDYGTYDIVELKGSGIGQNVVYTDLGELIFASGVINPSIHTSWAIADSEGNLYIACNFALQGFRTFTSHKRLGLKEVGFLDSVVKEGLGLDLEVELEMVSSVGLTSDMLDENVGISIEMEANNSTDYVQSLSQNIGVSIEITDEYPVQYYGELTQGVEVSDSITGIRSDDYVVNINFNLSVSDSITGDKYEPTPTPIWQTTGSTAYDGTVSLNTGSLNSTAVTLKLTEDYPPSGYALGWIMRCRVYSLDGLTLLGTTYRERGQTL